MTGRYSTQDAEYRADVLRYNGVGAALRTIISDVEHGIDRITHHETTAAQAAAAPTPTEDRMSIASTLHTIAADIEHVGEDVFDKARTIKATPEGAELFDVAHDIASWAQTGVIPATTLSDVLAAVKGFRTLAQGYVTAAQQQAQQAAQDPAQAVA